MREGFRVPRQIPFCASETWLNRPVPQRSHAFAERGGVSLAVLSGGHLRHREGLVVVGVGECGRRDVRGDLKAGLAGGDDALPRMAWLPGSNI